MKLKGKIFGGYLDLFPNVDHQHRGGVRLQSLESSKDTEEDGLRQNELSAETDILEMDKLQMIHLSGILILYIHVFKVLSHTFLILILPGRLHCFFLN